ncbi:anti-sigma factor [Paracoccaceae bacterium Fryx2]|nr:anti-sigma factor [Paracoccaceae bacterium Fryx2]
MTDARDPSDDPQDPGLLAAEYVLGVLPHDARLQAEIRAKRDPAFAALVAGWEERLAGLNDGFPEVPAPEILPRIEARLFGASVARRRFWPRFIGGLAAGAGIGLAVVLVTPTFQPEPALVATLSGEAQTLTFDARITGGALTLTRTTGPGPISGRDYELWLIAGEAAPRSLGVIGAEGLSLALPEASAPGMVLAVTLEPAGGSPTGTPTGPVLVTGILTSG